MSDETLHGDFCQNAHFSCSCLNARAARGPTHPDVQVCHTCELDLSNVFSSPSFVFLTMLENYLDILAFPPSHSMLASTLKTTQVTIDLANGTGHRKSRARESPVCVCVYNSFELPTISLKNLSSHACRSPSPYEKGVRVLAI
jgi:hypothetical protein